MVKTPLVRIYYLRFHIKLEQSWQTIEIIEGEASDNIYERLSHIPQAPVHVEVTPNPLLDLSNGAGNPVALTFNVDETNDLEFSLSPNPADDFLYINVPETMLNSEVRIYNEIGNLVFQEKCNGRKNFTISTDRPLAGSYTCVLAQGEKIYTKPFVKR